MEYKVWINYVLFKLKIRNILPAKIINRVVVNENNEELVKIDNDRLIIAQSVNSPYLRKSVYDKINLVSSDLEKQGLRLKIFDAYRSFEEQKLSWEKRSKETRDEYPNVSDSEIERLTTLKVAKPTKGHGGHQTGGAIDVSLTDLDGVELDMGTKYAEHCDKTKSRAKGLSNEQLANRRILTDVMTKYGFVNFPGEWWHFCYGDKMWAAYSNKKSCMYGYIEPEVDDGSK